MCRVFAIMPQYKNEQNADFFDSKCHVVKLESANRYKMKKPLLIPLGLTLIVICVGAFWWSESWRQIYILRSEATRICNELVKPQPKCHLVIEDYGPLQPYWYKFQAGETQVELSIIPDDLFLPGFRVKERISRKDIDIIRVCGVGECDYY